MQAAQTENRTSATSDFENPERFQLKFEPQPQESSKMPTAPPLQGVRLVMALLTSGHIAAGIDNGIGITPPAVGARGTNLTRTSLKF